MTWLLNDPVARWLLIGAVGATVVGETAASLIGQAHDGGLRRFGSPVQSVRTYVRGRGAVIRQDRGTRLIITFALYLGIVAAVTIAKVSALRAGADNWWTLGLGIGIALAGAALRDWAIVCLGRYFRRDVGVEPGQQIVRRGPYRLLRHPSYTGLLLACTGFGLAIGSWLSALAAFVILFAGLLPRIRVEERLLARTFGPAYTDYASSTARLFPRIW